MHSNLDILWDSTSLKYPPFPPTVKALAVLAYARVFRLASDGGLHGEER
jgi:hypothetical protein